MALELSLLQQWILGYLLKNMFIFCK